MSKIKIGTKEFELANRDIVFPSYNYMARSKMKLEFASELGEQEFMNLVDTTRDWSRRITLASESGEEQVLEHYVVLTSRGMREVSNASHIDGSVTKEMRYFIELEQLTFIEQQLMALGIRL